MSTAAFGTGSLGRRRAASHRCAAPASSPFTMLPHWVGAAIGLRQPGATPAVRVTQRTAASAPAFAHRPPPDAVPAELRGTPARTSGFENSINGRVLLVADAENLSYGLRKLGYDCDFGRLRKVFSSVAADLHAHAFACVRGSDAGRYALDYFRREGWQAHIGRARTVQSLHGPQVKANSDNQILLACGELIAALRPETLVLATGDGDLGCAISEFYLERHARGKVVVCSIRGATSHRLQKTANTGVHANAWLGWDCIVGVR